MTNIHKIYKMIPARGPQTVIYLYYGMRNFKDIRVLKCLLGACPSAGTCLIFLRRGRWSISNQKGQARQVEASVDRKLHARAACSIAAS